MYPDLLLLSLFSHWFTPYGQQTLVISIPSLFEQIILIFSCVLDSLESIIHFLTFNKVFMLSNFKTILEIYRLTSKRDVILFKNKFIVDNMYTYINCKILIPHMKFIFILYEKCCLTKTKLQ